MIYSKVENPKCHLCIHADKNNKSGNLLCEIRGTVPADFACKKFKYDIFKKTLKPKRNADKKSYSPDDFII